MSNYTTPPSTNNVRVTETRASALHEPLDDSPSLSIKDKHLKATLYFKEVAERLKDVMAELKEFHSVF